MKTQQTILHIIAVLALTLAACVRGDGDFGGLAEPEPVPSTLEGEEWLEISGAVLEGRLGSLNAIAGAPSEARGRYEDGLWFYLEHERGQVFGRAVLEFPYDWSLQSGVLVSSLSLADDPLRARFFGIEAEETDVILPGGDAQAYSCSGDQGGMCGNRRDAKDFVVRIAPCASCAQDARNIDFVFWTEGDGGDDEVTGQLTALP